MSNQPYNSEAAYRASIINTMGIDPVESDDEEYYDSFDEEPVFDNPGYRPCTCEDYPCCGH